MAKRTLILFQRTAKPDSTQAWARICFWIKKHCPNVFVADTTANCKKYSQTKFDNIIVPYGFGNRQRDLNPFLQQQKQAELFWLINEYDLTFDSTGGVYGRTFKERGFSVLANMAQHSSKAKNTTAPYVKNWHTINMNVSAYRDAKNGVPKKYDLIYWGRPRPGRFEYFEKYFRDKKIFLSTSTGRQKNNFEKWENLNIDVRYVDLVDFTKRNNILNKFKATIYLEDKFTHHNFNNLSDRFYEAISHEMVCFFDKSCANTVQKSKYPIPEFFLVDSLEELEEKTAEIYSEKKKLEGYFKELNERYREESSLVVREIKQILK